MRIPLTYLFVATTACLFGCEKGGDSLKKRERVTYYDRNGDGKVDLEKHRYPGVADADWELHDDDYSGRYEKKLLFGVGVIESSVDIRVPTGVKIEKKP
ncbi:MAG TPA: hypothetical protein VF593_13765 [Chthoniobacteraceae bacterium]|jgi:hypothetical protein